MQEIGEENQRQLRIVMVIDVFDTAPNGGVISTRRFVEQLRKRHDVKVITTGEPGDGKVIVKPFFVPGFRWAIERQDMVLGWPETKVLQGAIAWADVVHVQLPLPLGMRAIKVARALNKPVVSTFHVLPENLLLNMGMRSHFAVAMFHKVFIGRVYNRSDVVIAPSRFGQRELQQFGLKVPSKVISNGVGLEFVTAREDIQPKDTALFRVLAVGRLSSEKRQHLLLEAVLLSSHKECIEVTIVGRGQYEAKLRQLAAKLPVPPRIITTGVSADELLPLYRQSHLYVHSAGYELEGMTVLEAMACGLTPLIADAPKSAASQFAQDERSVFLDNDPIDLIRKIDYWIENPAELYAASLAHHAASVEYSLENSARQLEAVYQSLV